MSVASASPVANPPLSGGAARARRLLGLVQRFMRTGMGMARHVSGIARERLAGADLAQLAPAGFNATATHYLIVEAVAWTAALRKRLRARIGRPLLAFAPGLGQEGLGKDGRAPQGPGAAFFLPEASPEAAADPWNDWRELAKPLRIGPGGVAAAERAIDGLPDQDVVSNVCDKLKRVADDLGADADVARIAAMEAAALALCPEEAPAAKDEVAEPDEAQRTVAVAPAADDEPDDEADEEAEEAKAEAEAEADDAPEDEPDDKPEDEAAADPPTKPPD